MLLVGESPPANGKFFYVKSAMTTYTSRAFEKSHGMTFQDDAGFLRYFKECGCFLDDLCHTPVDNLPRAERERALERGVEPLSQRIRQANPPVVAIVLNRIERFVNIVQKCSHGDNPIDWT